MKMVAVLPTQTTTDHQPTPAEPSTRGSMNIISWRAPAGHQKGVFIVFHPAPRGDEACQAFAGCFCIAKNLFRKNEKRVDNRPTSLSCSRAQGKPRAAGRADRLTPKPTPFKGGREVRAYAAQSNGSAYDPHHGNNHGEDRKHHDAANHRSAKGQ